MSWQEYVDDHLMCALPNGGTLKSAAIVGLDGGVWAQSPEFPTLGDDEVRLAEFFIKSVFQSPHIIVDPIHFSLGSLMVLSVCQAQYLLMVFLEFISDLLNFRSG